MSPHPRSSPRSVALGALLVLPLVAVFAPSAAATTTGWTTLATIATARTAGAGPHDVFTEALNATVSLTIYSNSATGTIKVARCVVAHACTTSTLDTATSTGQPKVHRVSDTSAIGCWAASAASVWRVSRTSDGGISWTAPRDTVAGTLNGYGDCRVLPNGTVVVAATINGAALKWGVSAGIANYVPHSLTIAGSNGNRLSLQVASNTNWSLLVGEPTGVSPYVCTTSTWDGWTCTTLTGSWWMKTHQVSATTYITASISGTAPGIVRTDDGGLTWSVAATATTSNVQSADVAFRNRNGTAAILVVSNSTATAGGSPCRATTTSDGVTWASFAATRYASTSGTEASAAVTITTDGRYALLSCYTTEGGAGVLSILVFDLEAPATVASTATVTVPGLVGFSVDREGTQVLARNDTGYVRAFTGSSLVNTGNLDTRCSRNDGVFATPTVLAFITCDVPPPSQVPPAHYIMFRLADMVPQTAQQLFGNHCNFCETTIDLRHFGEVEVALNTSEFREVASFPFSFTTCTAGCGGAIGGHWGATASWAWSATNGRIGVATYTNVRTTSDAHWHVAADVLGAVTADQLCTFNLGPDDYLGAAIHGQPTKIWKVTYSVGGEGARVPHMERVQVLPSARGIACGAGHVLLTSLENAAWVVRSYDLVNGTQRGTFPLTGAGAVRGVTMSSDGDFGAFVEGSATRILRWGDQVVTGAVQHPAAGAFFGAAMGPRGADLWLAMGGASGSVSWFRLAGVCNAAGCLTTPDVPILGLRPGSSGRLDSGSGSDSVNLLKTGKGAVGKVLPGAGLPGVELGLSIVTMLGFAALAVKLTGGRFGRPEPNVVGAGGFAGMAFSVLLWDLSFWVPLLTAVAFLGLLLRRAIH